MSRRQRGERLPRTWCPSVRSAVSRHTPTGQAIPAIATWRRSLRPLPPAGCVRPPNPIPLPTPLVPIYFAWVRPRECVGDSGCSVLMHTPRTVA